MWHKVVEKVKKPEEKKIQIIDRTSQQKHPHGSPSTFLFTVFGKYQLKRKISKHPKGMKFQPRKIKNELYYFEPFLMLLVQLRYHQMGQRKSVFCLVQYSFNHFYFKH